MIGSLIKYGAVLLVGGIGFCIGGQYMDADVLERVKQYLDEHAATHTELTVEERNVKMQEYIAKNRSDWAAQLTFAGNLKQLELLFKPWV